MLSNTCRLLIFLLFAVTLNAGRALAEEDSNATLRLISYNVWYGFSRVPERKPDYLSWMKEQAPDIVSLQELNGYTDEKLAQDAKAWGHSHSALLKTRGFPTGITSRKPIDDIRRTQAGFHHGLLRAKIGDLYVYVIHLHPSNWETRVRETKLVLKDVASLPKGAKVILAGDFNTFSKHDAAYYKHGKLETFFSQRDQKNGEKNLRNGQLDYSVTDAIEAAGFTDLEHSRRNDSFVFTGSFPTKIEKPGDHGSARRLDYVFATSVLAARTTRAQTIASAKTWVLSDHLPVIVDLTLEH